MEKQKKVKIAFWMNLAIFVLECIGGYLYFIRSGWNFVQFYTEDSNTLALITCLFLAVYEYQMWKGQRSVLPGWIQELKYIATVCLTLTFLVVIFILIPLQGGIGSAYFFLINGSMLYHHLICPILAFVSFLWFDPMEKTEPQGNWGGTAAYAGLCLGLSDIESCQAGRRSVSVLKSIPAASLYELYLGGGDPWGCLCHRGNSVEDGELPRPTHTLRGRSFLLQ